MSCGEALVRLLEAYGVDTVFGIPGVHTVELYRGLPATAIRHVTPRHEQGAGFMADGYARLSGKPGVCLVITGPGMTNIATAMGQALADSIPLLVISSVNARHQLGMGEGRLHELHSQRAVFAGLSRFSHTLMRPDELPRVLARAFGLFASSRPGPVHIEIPTDVITLPADHLDLRPWPLPSAPAPAPAALDRAVALLRDARRPLVIVGGGALAAAPVLAALVERLDAPLLNTVNAKGLLPASHPLAVGGSVSSVPVREALQDADVVLALGTELAETDCDFHFAGDLGVSGALIRVDIDPAQLARQLRPALAICADVAQFVGALLPRLAEAPERGGGERARRLRQALLEERDAAYARFFETLQSALPDLVLVGDSCQPVYRAWLQYECERPRSYFHSASGYGTLGYALPAAIGAQLAVPERPVVALIGDGATLFTLGELAAAVEQALPVIFLVWNNRGYQEIRRFMAEGGIEAIGVDLEAPDFVGVAQAMGCAAGAIRDLDRLADELRAARNRAGPTLLELDEAGLLA